MNEFLSLIEKAKITLASSEFLEKNAEEQFKKMDHLNALPWSPQTEEEIIITMNKIKNLIAKSEIEYKNLAEVEAQVNKYINNKPRKD